jgi:hypothetical protein
MEKVMIPDPMEYLAQAKVKEHIEVAEMHRLIKRIEQEQGHQATTSWRIRNWLGKQLMTWGSRVQGKSQLLIRNS